MKKLYFLAFLILNYFPSFSQCGCDPIGCTVSTPGVTYFKIYYGSIITLNAPALPPNHSVVYPYYAWAASGQYITPDISNGLTQINFSSNSLTFDPLNYLWNPQIDSVLFVRCRTGSASCSGCSSCFYGRSFKVDFLTVPPPITNQVVNICNGQSVLLTANASVGTCEWYSNSCNGTLLGTGNSISVNPTTTTVYYVKAKNGNNGNYPNRTYSSCVEITVTVNSKPDNGGIISGSTIVCQGQSPVNYSIPSISNATSYNWTLPSGVTGSSSNNSISANFGASAISGNISVYGVNSCGSGDSSFLAVNVNHLPLAGGTISGATTVFQGQSTVTYKVPPIINASSYTWILPTGVTGSSSTNSITVNFGATSSSGNISVYGTNSCGSGSISTFGVIVNTLQSEGNKVGINTTTPARNLDINNTLRLQPRSTAPENPLKGDIYFDDTINKLRVFDGTVWQNCW